jgi:hypothetical protein
MPSMLDAPMKNAREKRAFLVIWVEDNKSS